jgi:hypothetical protein
MNARESGNTLGIVLLVVALMLAIPCLAGVGLVAFKMFAPRAPLGPGPDLPIKSKNIPRNVHAARMTWVRRAPFGHGNAAVATRQRRRSLGDGGCFQGAGMAAVPTSNQV